MSLRGAMTKNEISRDPLQNSLSFGSYNAV